MWIVLLLVFLPMSLLLSVHTKDLGDLSANPAGLSGGVSDPTIKTD